MRILSPLLLPGRPDAGLQAGRPDQAVHKSFVSGIIIAEHALLGGQLQFHPKGNFCLFQKHRNKTLISGLGKCDFPAE